MELKKKVFTTAKLYQLSSHALQAWKQKYLLALSMLLMLVLAPVSNASEADKEALYQIVKRFEEAWAKEDKAMMRALYTEDGMYFQRTGREAFGKISVVDLFFGSRTDTSSSDNSSPENESITAPSFKIITDAADTGSKFGYIYGRVCSTGSSEVQNCGTRWFLVTKKGEDGQWRIHADMDMPLKETIRDM